MLDNEKGDGERENRSIKHRSRKKKKGSRISYAQGRLDGKFADAGCRPRRSGQILIGDNGGPNSGR